ncbi:MAG TPA: hybrid sensor histidine kinase/response regulator [Actinomycetota bacterium]|nr:hybrid sensor histidine kinase/response regulator [Actinomycetota bacterium]
MQDEQLMTQLLDVFRDEAREHVQNAGRMLLELEKKQPTDPEFPELLAETFRAMHSLKGAARVVNLPEIADTSHRMESVLNAARSGDLHLTQEHFDLLLNALDELDNLINAALGGPTPDKDYSELHGRLEAALELQELATDGRSELPIQQITETDVPEPEAPTGAPDESIRVAASKLDVLLAQAGELLTAKIGVDQRSKELKELALLGEERARTWRRAVTELEKLFAGATPEDSVVLTRVSDALEELSDLTERIETVAQDLSADRSRIALVTSDLQDEIRRLRMLPISMIFDSLPRLVRDLARREGKLIDFVMGGADTEVDKRIMEGIKDPLIHLVNNAIDHGLETPNVRLAAGKPETGSLELTARMRGNEFILKVVDDGAGIDVHKVRDAALAKGLLRPEEIADAPHEDQLNLIFRSGLSTSSSVTDISGRGVGLDVVRENIEKLGGRLEVKTQVGRGTTFRMILPVSLATAEGLLLRAGGQRLAMPITAVTRILRGRRSEVHSIEGKPALIVNDEPLAVVRLTDLLEIPGAAEDLPHDFPVLLLSTVTKTVALVVDQIEGRQEMVVKALGKQLARVRNLVGATVLGSGEVVMVLNPLDLLKTATNDRRSRVVHASWAEQEEAEKKTILVADDSITTRNLERMTLESAGYAVKTAPDGQQAWRMLQTDRFDLVVTDLNMPHLNGLDLIRRIKGNARTQNVPVILLTSMGSAEDIARGMEVGADGYIVKSAFDRETIISTVGQLI